MQKILFNFTIIISILFIQGCESEVLVSELGLVPLPSSVSIQKGTADFSADWSINHNDGHPDLKHLKERLAENIQTDHGISLSKSSKQNISLNISENSTTDDSEDYELSIRTDEIIINASSPNGVFYGIQTLLQLLDSGKRAANKIEIQKVSIRDIPRFQWRGMHLDVGRHFFDVTFVKRYIDYLAMHKMNVFHWHLTEDQGWRVEIDAYPKLTEISAYRDESLIGHYSDKPHQWDGNKYGGYYTKEEMSDVVAYAQKQYITVVPEIEMPGHTRAVLAAYPELSCTGGPHTVAKLWGVHKEVFCAGKESTFEFLETVLTEVAEIFPSPYIHIGGDECPKDRWKEHDLDQQRIVAEGLHDEHELQSYFIKRYQGRKWNFDNVYLQPLSIR